MQNLSPSPSLVHKSDPLHARLSSLLERIPVLELLEVLVLHLKINPAQALPFLNYLLSEETKVIFDHVQLHLFQPRSTTRLGTDIIQAPHFWTLIQSYFLLLHSPPTQHTEYLYHKLKYYRKFKLSTHEQHQVDKSLDEIMYQHDKHKAPPKDHEPYESLILRFIEIIAEQLSFIDNDIVAYKQYLQEKVGKDNEYTKICDQKSTMMNNMRQKIMDRICSPQNYDTPSFTSKEKSKPGREETEIGNFDPKKVVLRDAINRIVETSEGDMMGKNQFSFKKDMAPVLSPANRVTTAEKLLNKENQLPYLKSSYKKRVESGAEVIRVIQGAKGIVAIEDGNMKVVTEEKVGVTSLRMLDSSHAVQVGQIAHAPISALQILDKYCIFLDRKTDGLDGLEDQMSHAIRLLEKATGNAYHSIVFVPFECLEKQ